jgi:hypothetical protein
VPPATSPWTVVITAAAAFLGVIVAQWWTGRREDRNWRRQREMYAHQWEDQRERDKEQREDQRQRDRESWAREDQHRFTDYKRDLYARQLHAIRNLQDSVQDILFRVRFGLSEGQRPFNDIGQFLGHDLIERGPELGRIASMTRDEISLVAPKEIERIASDLIGVLLDARGDLIVRENWKATRDAVEGFRLHTLTDAMRADLVGEHASPAIT